MVKRGVTEIGKGFFNMGVCVGGCSRNGNGRPTTEIGPALSGCPHRRISGLEGVR